MNLILKTVLPILIIAACVVTAKVVVANRPEPQTRPQFKSTTSIDATRVKKSDYPVYISTQGTVGASREGSLVPEVAGRIINVSPNFVVGGSFRRDEVLLEIDPRDYQIAVTLAEATFAQSKATLAEETARSQQASEDWKRLGRKGEPSALTLRKPQLAAARASLEAAKAQVQRAQLDLDRTKITASYDGSVLSKTVDLGQFINRGSTLAQIYAIDTAEIRLPFNNQQLGFVPLPGVGDNQNSPVILSASIGGNDYQWTGKITRTEGALDYSSRQLYMVAEVENPYSLQSDRPPLRVGQYVEAKVTGKILKDVYVIPRAALREEREVLIVDELSTLQSRPVNVVWKDAETAVIRDGLQDGDIISTTALGTVTNGTRVRATIDGVAPPSENRRGKPDSSSSPDSPTAKAGNPNTDGGRLEKLKAMVDGGGELPQGARTRFEAQIAAGEPVPQWVRDHISKSTK